MLDFDPDVDYYVILQVHPEAHREVIKRAYRTIIGMLQAHPDLGGDPEDAIRMNEAYRVLSHPETRKAYDEARRERLAANRRQAAPQSTAGMRSSHGAMPTVARPQPPMSTTTTRPPERPTSHHGEQMVRSATCPRCGTKNRLSVSAQLPQAICGKCHTPLMARRQERRDYSLPSGDMNLSPDLLKRLTVYGDILLQRSKTPANGRLFCRRCRYEWVERTAAIPPDRCPNCGDRRWGIFRVFACRFCHYQFSTSLLNTWPYWVFRECPSCHKKHWHVKCERNLLRWLLNCFGRR